MEEPQDSEEDQAACEIAGVESPLPTLGGATVLVPGKADANQKIREDCKACEATSEKADARPEEAVVDLVSRLFSAMSDEALQELHVVKDVATGQ